MTADDSIFITIKHFITTTSRLPKKKLLFIKLLHLVDIKQQINLFNIYVAATNEATDT